MPSERRAKSPSFVGRKKELAALRELVEKGERVIVVVGPSGIGKTRLVNEALKKHARINVDLSDARGADGLTSRVASAIGVELASARSDADRLRQLGRAVANVEPTALVLDGADAVRAAASRALEILSELAPSKTFYVTLRDKLGSKSVAVLELGPLSTEPCDRKPSEAAQLFVDRCAARGPEAPVPDPADPTLREIVIALGGVPLAIELAAARFERAGLRGLSEPLTDRALDMHASIAWSEGSLGEREQRALRILGVFDGTFSLAAAEAVLDLGADESIDGLLETLAEASLLSRSTFDDSVERFHLEESVRSFATERLRASGEEVLAIERHDEYFLGLGKALSHRVEAFGDIHARAQLASELENLLAVHARKLSNGDASKALDALLAIDAVLATQVSAQVRLDLWVELERRLGQGTPRAIDVLAGLGRALAGVGRLEDARSPLEEAAKLAEQASASRAAHLYIDLGLVFHATAKLSAARDAYARALEIESRQPDERLRARAWGNLGAVLHDERKLDGAKRNYERSLAYARQVGDARIEGIMLTNLGVLEQELRAYERARTSLEGAVRLLEPSGDRRLTAIAKSNLMTLLLECGELDGARFHGEAALTEQRAMGDLKSLILIRARMAVLFAMLADAPRAHAEHEEARRLASELRDESASAVLDVAACFLQLATSDADREAIATEVRRVAMTPQGEGEAPFDRSDEVRTMLRIAEGLAAKPEQASAEIGGLVVSPEADAFRAPTRGTKPLAWVSLERESPAQRVFVSLVRLHNDKPEAGLSMEEIASVAWPGELVPAAVRASRVYALIGGLRQLGLAATLLRRPGGYLLDPEVPIATEAAPMPANPAQKKRKTRVG